MKHVLILFSFIGSLLLSGCGNLQYYMTQMSNKSNPSQAASSDTQNNLPAPKCDHWCHNGWCSEHCEGDVNQNQW